jgi:hypothetical protein
MYVTKQKPDAISGPGDRRETDSGAPHIEVTPEMIEAGVLALQVWSGTDEGFDIGAISVYRAMHRVRLARESGGSH